MPFKQTMMNQKSSEVQVRHVLRKLVKLYPDAIEQPSSGNTAWSPNDIYVPHTLQIECKVTTAKSMRIEFSWFDRARQLCSRNGLRALLALRIFGNDFYLVEEDVMLHLLKCEQEVNARMIR